MDRRRVLKLVLGSSLAGVCAAAVPAAAAAYPNRPVRIIAPFAAGGSSDITARVIGQYMSERTAQPFVVENLPGASGIVGT